MTPLKSTKETAADLGLAKHTLDKWRIQGRGPRYVVLGRRVAYRPEDIEAFITAGIRRSTSETPGGA